MIVVKVWLILLMIICGIGILLKHLIFRNETKKIEPIGQRIKVKNGYMHVVCKGTGKHTIVLLPGLSVPLPSVDFDPLMDDLSKEFTVVIIEYFGVGFSSQTADKRSNENIVREIREVLLGVEIKPPYILMPHSASGIYAEYYASVFPDEIAGLIMMDTTSSATVEKDVPQFVYSLSYFLQKLGLTVIVNYVVTFFLLKRKYGYTKEQQTYYRKFYNNVMNPTVIDQNIEFIQNVKEVQCLDFPAWIPVLKLIAKSSVKQLGFQYQQDHLQRLGSQVKYMILPGHHFLYQKLSKEIFIEVKKFVQTNFETEVFE